MKLSFNVSLNANVLTINVSLFERHRDQNLELSKGISINIPCRLVSLPIYFPYRIPFSLLMGFLIGVFLNYLLYRTSFPEHPFIYVSF
jgi:ABC-type enterochelin transport system permease subunit